MDGSAPTPSETQTFIALGGNLGEVAKTFQHALDELETRPEIRIGTISDNHATPAVGEQAGGGFLNAAAELWVSLEPHALLRVLQSVETQLGRVRTRRWAPRTIDLDLIFYGDRIIDTPDLQVPHPACWYRRFVLDPLAEIAGGVVHPTKHVTVRELRRRLLERPLPVGLCGGNSEVRRELGGALSAEFAEIALNPDWKSGDQPPALLCWLGDPLSESAAIPFESLPRPPRLDATVSEPLPFLRDVLAAAIGN